MKRYTFRLQAVLNARRTQEELARAELLRANLARRQAAARHEAEAARYRSLAAGAAAGATSTAQFLTERCTGELAAATLADAKTQRDAADSDAVARTAAWTDAARAVTILERLETRRRAEHAAAAARVEVAEADDLTAARTLAAGTPGGDR